MYDISGSRLKLSEPQRLVLPTSYWFTVLVTQSANSKSVIYMMFHFLFHARSAAFALIVMH